MIKNNSRRRLTRTGSHRRALLRNLSTSLLLHEKIATTFPKAKEVQWFAERLITVAKKGKHASIRRVRIDIQDRKVVDKLFDVIAKRYSDRNGGYTRIYKTNVRKGDAAQMAVIKLIQ